MKIEDALFLNRDENSFTARLFEGSIFPACYRELDASQRIFFPQFIQRINKGLQRCSSYSKLLAANIPDSLEFKEGMLFVECIDLFAANQKACDDKTEFDAIIAAYDEVNQKNVLLVFEVKCFSDLNCSEIIRQQKRLEELTTIFENLPDNQGFEYYHIALIAEDNLKHATKLYAQLSDAYSNKSINNFSIITWEDLLGDIPESDYLMRNRIKTISRSLSRTISGGVGSKPTRGLMIPATEKSRGVNPAIAYLARTDNLDLNYDEWLKKIRKDT
jgi:hypothetical protein